MSLLHHLFRLDRINAHQEKSVDYQCHIGLGAVATHRGGVSLLAHWRDAIPVNVSHYHVQICEPTLLLWFVLALDAIGIHVAWLWPLSALLREVDDSDARFSLPREGQSSARVHAAQSITTNNAAASSTSADDAAAISRRSSTSPVAPPPPERTTTTTRSSSASLSSVLRLSEDQLQVIERHSKHRACFVVVLSLSDSGAVAFRSNFEPVAPGRCALLRATAQVLHASLDAELEALKQTVPPQSVHRPRQANELAANLIANYVLPGTVDKARVGPKIAEHIDVNALTQGAISMGSVVYDKLRAWTMSAEAPATSEGAATAASATEDTTTASASDVSGDTGRTAAESTSATATAVSRGDDQAEGEPEATRFVYYPKLD